MDDAIFMVGDASPSVSRLASRCGRITCERRYVSKLAILTGGEISIAVRRGESGFLPMFLWPMYVWYMTSDRIDKDAPIARAVDIESSSIRPVAAASKAA